MATSATFVFTWIITVFFSKPQDEFPVEASFTHMSNFIPPARVRQEDEFFINSLARAYHDKHWSEETLKSIAADALRMIRHLATRYSDQSCVELNGEELEAEGRRKFIEQFTRTRVLQGFPQRLRGYDVVTAVNGCAVNSVDDLNGELSASYAPGDAVVVDYYRYGKNGAVRLTLGGKSRPCLGGVHLLTVDEHLRVEHKAALEHYPANTGGVFVRKIEKEEPLLFGRTPNPPTRGDLFKWFKSCINNHIRGIVHRCRFTVRRTGRKVPPKDSKLDWNRSFKPEVSLEAASEDDHLNRAVERAASVWDSNAVSEFDTDMGAERYALFEISHPDNSTITIGDLSQELRLTNDELRILADSYRRRYSHEPHFDPLLASSA